MSTSSAPLNVLVAGAGAFGREHIARLAVRPDVSLVGVADVNAAALEPVQSRYGALRCLADPSRLIDDMKADAIVIATPAGSHVELCMHALGRSLCVLLEKPIAPSAAAAAPLVSSVRLSSGFVLPGHVLRFSAGHERLIEIVRSGRIGEVVYVNSRRYRDDTHAVRYPDTDPILMTLIHDVDLALWLTNTDFRSVLARRSGAGCRSMTAVSATTTNGVVCDLRTAWTFEDGDLPPDCLEVVGARGSVELVVGQNLRLYADGGCADYPAVEADDPLRNEQDHFLECVRDRSIAPAVDLAQALAGLKLADAAMESLRLNREVFLSA